jgi:hypothetical protein
MSLKVNDFSGDSLDSHSQDDDEFSKIGYNVLVYLNQCSEMRKKPNVESFNAESFSTTQKGWTYIVRSLQNDGYIKNAKFLEDDRINKDGVVENISNIEITPKGEMLLNNGLKPRIARF